jgi:hypothetical protein
MSLIFFATLPRTDPWHKQRSERYINNIENFSARSFDKGDLFPPVFFFTPSTNSIEKDYSDDFDFHKNYLCRKGLKEK